MSNKNIQMKKKEGSNWTNLYPVSLDTNIVDVNGVSVDVKKANKTDVETEITETKNLVNAEIGNVNNSIGDINVELSQVNTELTNVDTKVGNTTQLVTSQKANIVDAVNELHGRANLSSPNLIDRKLEVIAGVIRQDSTDPTKWEFLNDLGHVPSGIDIDTVLVTDDTLSFTLTKDYGRVVSLVVAPDEDFSQRLGCTMGASVGTNAIFIKGRVNFKLQGNISVNPGGSINSGTKPGSITLGTPTYSGPTGRMTVPHLFCPGSFVTVYPQWSGLDGETYFMPVIENVLDDSFTVRFIDTRTGSPVSGEISSKISFTFEKNYNGPIPFNRGDLHLYNGNIWLIGVFEV